MAWGSKKKGKSKFFNKKVERDEILFDSELERYAYDMLKELNIPFELKKPIILQPPHVNWEGKTIKRIKILVDFTIVHPEVLILFDPKGRATEEANLKFKWLSYKLIQEGRPHIIRWADSNHKIRIFLHMIKDKYFNYE